MATATEGASVGEVLDAAIARLAAAGVEAARLDAELLLADALGLSRAAALARRPELLAPEGAARFAARVARRAAREPVAYILGRQEFYGLEFEVAPGVLIPRPESELLVDEALRYLGALPQPARASRPAHPPLAGGYPAPPIWGGVPYLSDAGETHPGLPQPAEQREAGEAGSAPRSGGECIAHRRRGGGASSVGGVSDVAPGPLVVDVGTGSGCLAVTLAVHAPQARVIAVDPSAAALAIARRNARRHAVASQVRFVRGDLLEAVAGPVDLVVANLPYVATDEVERLMPDVRLYEPRVALDGGADGLSLLRPLVARAAGRLAPGGLLALEVAQGQAPQVVDLLRSTGAFSDVSTGRDLAGIERMVCGRTWTRS